MRCQGARDVRGSEYLRRVYRCNGGMEHLQHRGGYGPYWQSRRKVNAIICTYTHLNTYYLIKLKFRYLLFALHTNEIIIFCQNPLATCRYRKSHLFDEPQFNVTKTPELVTFTTDYGVTYGLFVCFDIFFKKPTSILTRDKNVTEVLFSTAWFSVTPFLTGI